MKAKNRRLSHRMRTHIAHRILYYLAERTSAANPEWRNITINFIYQLYNAMQNNPALYIVVHAVDGMLIFYGRKPVARIQLNKRHWLAHAKEQFTIWSKAKSLFGAASIHKPSLRIPGPYVWPGMWRLDKPEQIESLLSHIQNLPKKNAPFSKMSRSIPVAVRQEVYERDRGRCQGPACGTTEDLHYDHILPFSKGGASKTAKNIQLLCMGCNLKKAANL